MEPMNDKSWISIGNRVDPRYVHGVTMFLDFAESNSRLPDGLIHCPCKKCKNIRMYQRQEVGRHLIMYGIMPDYTNWNKHGERRQRSRWKTEEVNVEDVEYSTSNAPKRIPAKILREPQPQPHHQPQPQPQPQLIHEDPKAVDGSTASIGEGGSASSGARKRRRRGPCAGKSLAPRDGGVWTMQYNSDGLPTGEPAMKLHRKIGDLVRDPRYCPLRRRWKDVPVQGKEYMWDELLVEYDFGGHPNMKKYVFDHAQQRYKDWKNYLKHDIWSKYKHDEELLNAKLKCRVVPAQFKKMVEYWESEGGKAEALRLSTNRSKKLMHHHSGTQTFVQLGTKMTTNGVGPDPMDVFMKAYTPKDPAKDPQTVRMHMLEEISTLRQSQSSQGSEATSSMQPILTQVLGEGKRKYVRGLGGHHTEKDIATSEGQYMTQQMAKLVNENQTLTSIVQQLQTQLDDTNTVVGFMKDWMSSICGKLNMPVPNIPMRLSMIDERRSAADEAQGSRPDSSRQS